MRILASAQPFGFGPVAKLVGLVAQLESAQVTFAGRGIALRYARLNNEQFVAVAESDFTQLDSGRDLVRHFDGAIGVMEPQLVYACVREHRPVHFFDSLLGFWLTDRSLDELTEIAWTIRYGSDVEAEEAFGSLSVHESMVVSHMVSTRSCAQSFPGVAERIQALSPLGFDTIKATGPMIDLQEIDRLRAVAPPKPRTLVANLGGFTNAFLSYAQHGFYVDIMLRWLRSLARQTSRFDEIVVCSGAFEDHREEMVNGVRIRIGLLPHAELLQLLAGRPIYLAAPGLTSLHEAVALDVPMMLLPDEHYGHTHNRSSLQGTSLAAYGASFSDLGLDSNLPHNDLEGTLAIARFAAEVARDPSLFRAFATYMNHRLDAFLAMVAAEMAAYVAEIKGLVAGTPVAEVMTALQEELRGAAAGHRP